MTDCIDILIDLYGRPWPKADWRDVCLDVATVMYRQHGPYSGHTLSLAARMPTREGACDVIRAGDQCRHIIPPGPYDPADLNPELGHGVSGPSYLDVRHENGSHR